jgi:hypothetical protein
MDVIQTALEGTPLTPLTLTTEDGVVHIAVEKPTVQGNKMVCTGFSESAQCPELIRIPGLFPGR